MSSKVDKVIRGWLELSEDEKRSFDDFLRKYKEGGYSQKSQLRESVFHRLQSGPLGSSCPCCGR